MRRLPPCDCSPSDVELATCIERSTAAASYSPPKSRTSSSARSIHARSFVVGRLESQHQHRAVAVAHAGQATSAGFEQAELVGFRPDCDSARTKVTAASSH